MKKLKWILRIIILSHVFPITGILLAHDNNDSILKGYCMGWIINGFILGIILAIIFLMWLFDDEYDYDNYY